MIKIKNAVKRFDDVVAVDKITCTIENGSVFGLIGSNGSGKSTLLRCATLLEQMDGYRTHFDRLYESIKKGDREGIREMMRLSTARRQLFDKKV